MPKSQIYILYFNVYVGSQVENMDHVCIKNDLRYSFCGIYGYHHALVERDGDSVLVHHFDCKGVFKTTSLDRFTVDKKGNVKPLYKVTYKDRTPKANNTVAGRLQQWLRKINNDGSGVSFSAMRSNCEHVITFLKYEEKFSAQIWGCVAVIDRGGNKHFEKCYGSCCCAVLPENVNRFSEYCKTRFYSFSDIWSCGSNPV